MTELSRRAFLTLSGATLLAAVLPEGFVGAGTATPDALVGRALRAVPVYRHRAEAAAIVRHLWPDGVTPIQGRDGAWFAVLGGFVQATDLQPMPAYDPALATPVPDLPAWITAVAPVAPVRAWAAGAAPLVTRIGYGGVLCAVDTLRDDAGADWYGVSATPDGEPLGWTPAQRWSHADDAAPGGGPAARGLRLDRQRAELVARDGDQVVLRAPVTVPRTAQRGAWTLHGRQPTLAGPLSDGELERFGVSWVLASDNLRIYGAYWHNAFGTAGDGPGWEVSPLVACWLYGWLPDGAVIEVV